MREAGLNDTFLIQTACACPRGGRGAPHAVPKPLAQAGSICRPSYAVPLVFEPAPNPTVHCGASDNIPLVRRNEKLRIETGPRRRLRSPSRAGVRLNCQKAAQARYAGLQPSKKWLKPPHRGSKTARRKDPYWGYRWGYFSGVRGILWEKTTLYQRASHGSWIPPPLPSICVRMLPQVPLFFQKDREGAEACR